MDCYGRALTVEQFQLLQEQFGFLPELGVIISMKGSSIYDFSQRKVGVPVPLFEAGLHLPMYDFFDIIVHHCDFSVDELTPSVVNKIMGFELIYGSPGCIPTCWVFSYFFCMYTNFGVRMLAKRRGIHQLISEQDNPKKNWQKQWLWKDFILAAADMSAAWRVCGNMAQLFVMIDGAKADVSLEMALHGHYQELARLLPTEGGNVGSSGPASSTQLGVGTTIPSHSTASSSADILMVNQVGKKAKHSVRAQGGIGYVHGDVFSAPGRKEIVVVPISSNTSPYLFIDSLTANPGACSVLGGALGMLGGFPPSDITYMVEKWSYCAHPPATIKFLAAQSEACMAGNLRYAAAQTSALMVAAADQGVLARGLARCQCQLAHARVDGVAALGNLQWVLENGMVRVINKVIASEEFSSGIQGLQKACEALGLENGKQLACRPTTSSESNAPDLDHVSGKVEAVDVALSSLSETDFAGHFRL
ncbi:unnamed protein product [Lactuca saligna]|uniref:Uncharacterized protein n=1 Tax=Lactuca saligna TaxID=75948 RepID=A0AA35Y671_LACSI|nr:unnamed protein product [Lactuca saligna]